MSFVRTRAFARMELTPQFAFMVKYGMTPMQAIQSQRATLLICWQVEFAGVAPGWKYADIIAVSAIRSKTSVFWKM